MVMSIFQTLKNKRTKNTILNLPYPVLLRFLQLQNPATIFSLSKTCKLLNFIFLKLYPKNVDILEICAKPLGNFAYNSVNILYENNVRLKLPICSSKPNYSLSLIPSNLLITQVLTLYKPTLLEISHVISNVDYSSISLLNFYGKISFNDFMLLKAPKLKTVTISVFFEERPKFDNLLNFFNGISDIECWSNLFIPADVEIQLVSFSLKNHLKSFKMRFSENLFGCFIEFQ